MRNVSRTLLVTLLTVVTHSAVAAAEPSSPRKVGVIIPLSGPMAEWGQSIQIGINFQANRLGTTTHYIFEDEAACDAKKAVTAAQKLISVDKVDILMTGCLNGTQALLPISKKADVLVVSLGLVNNDLAKENRDYLITPSASITAEADGISDLLKADGKKRLALVRVEDNFTEELTKGLLADSKQDGWELVLDERLTFNTTDFRPALLKLARHGADSVLFYTSTEQVVNAVRQFKELKIANIGIYGGYVIEADPPPANDLTILDGVKYAAAVTPVDDELSRHLALNGSKETFQTRVGADAVADVEKALLECSGVEKRSRCLRTTITSRTNSTPAFSGGFSYDDKGLASRTVRGKYVANGAYHWIDYSKL